MSTPVLGPFGTDLYNEFEPVSKQDYLYGYALAWFCNAIGTMLDEVETYARDGANDEPGWSILLDVNRAPTKALPWLAQFVGAKVPSSMSDPAARARIVAHPNFARGTPALIIQAAQLHLTGTKDVLITERYNGDPYALYVATRTDQTPSSAQTLADIMSAKPAGIVLTYETITGQTFNELLTNTPLFSNTYSTYATMQGVLKSAPGT
jgi:hypothetical protein